MTKTPFDLTDILAKHKLWLRSEEGGGECANLEGANLRGADLEGANLRGANLEGANLENADLRGANLEGANLEGANLRGANLRGANLRGANLRGADLEDTCLFGDVRILRSRKPTHTPVLRIGPIGSRNDTLSVFGTDHGVIVRTGCFVNKSLDEFRQAVEVQYGPTNYNQRAEDILYYKEYMAAIKLIEARAELWAADTSV